MLVDEVQGFLVLRIAIADRRREWLEPGKLKQL